MEANTDGPIRFQGGHWVGESPIDTHGITATCPNGEIRTRCQWTAGLEGIGRMTIRKLENISLFKNNVFVWVPLHPTGKIEHVFLES